MRDERLGIRDPPGLYNQGLPMHVTAIIAAAGSGRRVGSAQPKQMLDIGGGSMLQHSVAAFAALQSRDTVKRVDAGGTITETIPRETIYLAQTPQGFRRDVLARAVAAARSGVEATDEAALAERAGDAVHVVDGDPGNVKITTAQDLEAARLR